ncbi:MAG: endonuclease III [Planctomycetota bacterium]|jgi:endonuclease-3
MPRESKADLKKRTAKIVTRLKKRFPNATCSLRHDTPLQLLIATILSAQCTDDRVNIVTEVLFAKYKTAADFAKVTQAALEKDIRSTGFFRNKAKNIRAAAGRIVDDFGGKVPRSMDDLLTLPGVARKTANVVLSNAFGKHEGVVVDTHVKRISGRLGLTTQTDPIKIERDLVDLVAHKDWGLFSHLLIFHGRQTCTARNPNCPDCVINKLCPSVGKA